MCAMLAVPPAWPEVLGQLLTYLSELIFSPCLQSSLTCPFKKKIFIEHLLCGRHGSEDSCEGDGPILALLELGVDRKQYKGEKCIVDENVVSVRERQ